MPTVTVIVWKDPLGNWFARCATPVPVGASGSGVMLLPPVEREDCQPAIDALREDIKAHYLRIEEQIQSKSHVFDIVIKEANIEYEGKIAKENTNPSADRNEALPDRLWCHPNGTWDAGGPPDAVEDWYVRVDVADTEANARIVELELEREEAISAMGDPSATCLVGRCKSIIAQRAEARAGRREAAQILIEEIGAPGPESVVETAKRAVKKLRESHDRNAELEQARDALLKNLDGIYDTIGHEGPERHPTSLHQWCEDRVETIDMDDRVAALTTRIAELERDWQKVAHVNTNKDLDLIDRDERYAAALTELRERAEAHESDLHMLRRIETLMSYFLEEWNGEDDLHDRILEVLTEARTERDEARTAAEHLGKMNDSILADFGAKTVGEDCETLPQFVARLSRERDEWKTASNANASKLNRVAGDRERLREENKHIAQVNHHMIPVVHAVGEAAAKRYASVEHDLGLKAALAALWATYDTYCTERETYFTERNVGASQPERRNCIPVKDRDVKPDIYEAPERVWCTPHPNDIERGWGPMPGEWHTVEQVLWTSVEHRQAEYVRADVADRDISAIRAERDRLTNGEGGIIDLRSMVERLNAECERWRKQSDAWQTRGWGLGSEADAMRPVVDAAEAVDKANRRGDLHGDDGLWASIARMRPVLEAYKLVQMRLLEETVERASRLQEVLGTRNRTDAISRAIDIALNAQDQGTKLEEAHEALRKCAEYTGGLVSPECSHEFHLHVAGQVKGHVARLQSRLEKSREEIDRLRKGRSELGTTLARLVNWDPSRSPDPMCLAAANLLQSTYDECEQVRAERDQWHEANGGLQRKVKRLSTRYDSMVKRVHEARSVRGTRIADILVSERPLKTLEMHLREVEIPTVNFFTVRYAGFPPELKYEAGKEGSIPVKPWVPVEMIFIHPHDPAPNPDDPWESGYWSNDRDDEAGGLPFVSAEKADIELKKALDEVSVLREASNKLLDAIIMPKGRDFQSAWEAACLQFGRHGESPTLFDNAQVVDITEARYEIAITDALKRDRDSKVWFYDCDGNFIANHLAIGLDTYEALNRYILDELAGYEDDHVEWQVRLTRHNELVSSGTWRKEDGKEVKG